MNHKTLEFLKNFEAKIAGYDSINKDNYLEHVPELLEWEKYKKVLKECGVIF